jgi:hypothetical protein
MGSLWSADGGSQFIGVDRAGRVSFFRGADLSVVRQLATGAFAAPSKLEATKEAANRPLSAALSLSGDRWFLRTADSLRLFVGGKEKLLPQPTWQPWSIGFVGDTPVAAVIPLLVGTEGAGSSKQSSVPWLLAFDGNKWSPLVEHRDLTVGESLGARADLNDFIAQYALILAGARDGKLWSGNQYSYQIRRFSGAGKKLFELRVDGGKVIDKKEKSAKPLPAGAQAFSAASIIRGLAEGRDGFLYLVVSPSGDGTLVLDRYDPSRAVLERVALPKLQDPGFCGLDAGKDGLYFAPRSSKGGRWRLSWEALEKASWSEVKNVEVQGGGR